MPAISSADQFQVLRDGKLFLPSSGVYLSLQGYCLEHCRPSNHTVAIICQPAVWPFAYVTQSRKQSKHVGAASKLGKWPHCVTAASRIKELFHRKRGSVPLRQGEPLHGRPGGLCRSPGPHADGLHRFARTAQCTRTQPTLLGISPHDGLRAPHHHSLGRRISCMA